MESPLYAEQQRSQQDLITVADLFNFLRRRKGIILTSVGTFFLLGIIYCSIATRRYQSTALLEVQKSEDTLGLNTLGQSGSVRDQAPSPLEETVTLETKVNELTSDGLDLLVIERLKLEGTKDYQHKFDPIGALFSIFSKPVKETPGKSFMDSPSRRARALAIFQGHLKVKVVPGTRLISIQYFSPEPDLAPKVVNELAADLAQYGFKIKTATTQQLSEWLNGQLDTVRRNVEKLQEQEVALRRETQRYDIGSNASGQATLYSPVIDQLQQSTTALNQAESNRILRSAVEKIVQTHNPQLISGLAGSGMLSSGDPQSSTSLELINNLEAQIAQQQATVDRDQVILGEDYPRLIQEKAMLRSLKSGLQAEIDRLSQRAKNDSEIATAQEQHTRAKHEELLRKAETLDDKYLRYRIVQQEAEDARQLYAGLDQRLRQVGVTIGVQSADTSLFAPGLTADKPSSPRTTMIVFGALCVGLLLGGVIAIVIDLRDDKISSPLQLEAAAGLPVFGVIPRDDSSEAHESLSGSSSSAHSATIEVLNNPGSRYSEALRSLRTGILLSHPGGPPRVILVTSGMPGEGKSFTALNLAATFARIGSKTLLVDTDLRTPSLASKLRMDDSQHGLSMLLNGQLEPRWKLSVKGIPNLSFIPAGPHTPDPHELIGSGVMRSLIDNWRLHYDVVILDSSPLIPVSDAILLAEQSELVLIVVRYGMTTLTSIHRAIKLLPRHLSAQIGTLFNAVPAKSMAYREHFGVYEPSSVTSNRVGVEA